MSLRWRLALLVLFATALPALIGLWEHRRLVSSVLDVAAQDQLDEALAAGVRQARNSYVAARDDLEATAVVLAEVWENAVVAEGDPGAGRRALVEARLAWLDPADRAVLLRPDGAPDTLQVGRVPVDVAPRAPNVPPAVLSATADLPGGRRLELARAMDADWRQDAARLVDTHQMVRGLRADLDDRERQYWLRFVGWLLVALVIVVPLALHLARGITGPLLRLLRGTDEVAAGHWNVQVPPAGRDELGRLTDGFNAMVRTIGAQNRRLVDLEKLAGWREMARALAHEVKNPLTPIQLTVEEIRARYPGGDAKYQQLLEECTRIVIAEVESLRSIVQRFREFSRPVELETAPVDLGELVRDVAALQRDLRIEVHVDDRIGTVDADADRLRQVLMNLAANAREATAQAQEPRLGLQVRGERDAVVVTVEDNGPGIEPVDRDRVFEPYRSGRAGGLGLGLALVKGIVLAHGGSIAVDAGRWGGARFTIRLPRRAPESAASPNREGQDV
jgi:nitrogen fixation/metabolism regulation signal transduction histidine kinase